MKKHNQYLKKEQVYPVDRKTNEEIEEDEDGNLLIGGKYTEIVQSVPSHKMPQKDGEGQASQED